MVKIVYSAGLKCLEGYIVQVEADISDGMPAMDLVGYLGSEVKEARERVRTAIKNSGYDMPLKRITLNLAPADVKKYGTGFDLAMAVGILLSMGVIPETATQNAIFLGELNLSGSVCPIRGILPLVLHAMRNGFKRCYVPKDNAAEAALVTQMEILPVSSLEEITEHLRGEICIAGIQYFDYPEIPEEDTCDLKYVYGQKTAKRGLEIAASGLHNVILFGEPGSGKSMLSKCIPSILPPMTMEEKLEVSSIYSVAGKLTGNTALIGKRPFVSVHHTVTDVALIGGGAYPRAGLAALAHKGVLFLDEMPEFKRSSLEALRQPLEDRVIRINRNLGNFSYPADFMLVGAMNPCPCGAYPDERCNCTFTQRKKYLERLSKPLLDRIDLSIEVRNPGYGELNCTSLEEDSATVAKRVKAATEIQFSRFSRPRFNSQMDAEEIRRFCEPDGEGKKIMEKAFEKYRLSARGYHRILKVARTIADLDKKERIGADHLIEAIRFRNTDLLKMV